MPRSARQLQTASLLLCSLLAQHLLVTSTVSAETPFDCSASPRAGPTLFGPESPPDNGSFHHHPGHPHHRNHTFVIMQCGTKAPSLVLDLEALRKGWWKVPFQDQSAVINAAYAAKHGYRYEFYEVDDEKRKDTLWMRWFGGGSDVHPAWCRVPAMLAALESHPLAVLYLDQDSYIRTEAPLSVKSLRVMGRQRAIGMDDGMDTAQGIYRFVHATPQVSKTMGMPELQTGFDHSRHWVDTFFKKDILNTGGGWMELGHPPGSPALETTRSFLREWWQLGQRWQGGKWRMWSTKEQRILTIIMGLRRDVRLSTAMLEDTLYNSPHSPCIPHMYGEYKDEDTGARQVMADLAVHKAVDFEGKLNLSVVGMGALRGFLFKDRR